MDGLWRTGLVTAFLALRLGGETPRPVKLQVDLPAKSVNVGERAKMRVRLVDANNLPVAAPKDFAVDIVARLPTNATEKLTSAVLRAGQSELSVDLPPAKTEGFLYIWAKQAELLFGGTYLRVKTRIRRDRTISRAPAAVSPPVQASRAERSVATAAEAPTSRVLRRLPIGTIVVARPGQPPPSAPPAATPAEPQPQTASRSAAAAAEPPPQPVPAGGNYLLALRYSPQRTFLANGKDPATVHAFVMAREDAPLPGFRLQLFDTSGTLRPVPLVIPPGAEEGVATLTSTHAGDIKVEYLGSAPRVELEGEKIMTVSFEPPIVGVELKPSPARLTLVDTCDLVSQFVDEGGRPLATKGPRKISLALLDGRGDLSAKDFAVDPGNSGGRVTFTPVWWGPATVSASTPNLLTVTATLQVDPPFALLGISLVGGLLGGYVFMLRRRGSKWWRIPLGALTGVILFWAFLFLGLSVLPRAAILNPLSVFVISVLGGWLGTGVFEPVLKRFGLGASGAN